MFLYILTDGRRLFEGEGGREMTGTDELSRRSIAGMLSVVRDRSLILVGLVIAMLGAFFISSLLFFIAGTEASLLLFIGPQWLTTGILVGFVIWVEKRPLASIGATGPSWPDLWLGLAGTVVGLLTVPVTISLTNALGFNPGEEALTSLLEFPLWALIVIVITAAITEEVLFRAYPIERFTELTGSVWIAAGLSFVAFVLVHVPFWGVGHIVTISGISVILTVLYVRYRRLWPVMSMHFLTNFVLLIVFPMLDWL